MNPFVILVVLLAIQLIINLLFVIWFAKAFQNFKDHVQVWIQDASNAVKRELTNFINNTYNDSYAFNRQERSSFMDLMKMVDERIKKASSKPKNTGICDHYFSTFGVYPASYHKPGGPTIMKPIVKLVNTDGKRHIVPVVYIELDRNYASNGDQYDPVILDKLRAVIIEAYGIFNEKSCLPREMGKPVLCVYKTGMSTHPKYKTTFSGIVVYHDAEFGRTACEVIENVEMDSNDSAVIFNAPHAFIHGSDIRVEPSIRFTDASRYIATMMYDARITTLQMLHWS